MTYLSQWLAEAQADATEDKLQNERMARALYGILSAAPRCPVCASNVQIAQAAVQGVQRPPAPAVDPHTGCLIDVEGVPV